MQEPILSVGILSADLVPFELVGDFIINGEVRIVSGIYSVSLLPEGLLFGDNIYSELVLKPLSSESIFTLNEVVIGIDFHWERKESQSFRGSLKLIVEGEKVTAINLIPVEEYLKSVISSEMSATASPELLKAHAVISRSWLLSQLEKRTDLSEKTINYVSETRDDSEWIKWWDREDHTLYDVCADDHCQRYQGITKASTEKVVEAVEATRGELLTFDDKICDARFSKCCGGMMERFENCWEPASHPYLQKVFDRAENSISYSPDLTNEVEAEGWIRTSPDAFCNTKNSAILSQVLNNYDQETTDFYRWSVTYTQEELTGLLRKRTAIDFGEILDLIPVERGVSGRMIRLKVVGSKCTMIIGKELLIRKSLSNSHLYSSAFVVDKEGFENGFPSAFTLTGAGWGHGVGLCQIGAAVMGESGYSYKQILQHYYRDVNLVKQY
ncbi:MAG: SpoIID/LytB domain-containing protein [Bacteroidales bacterium]|nr:SpoIID/LytB domain-containing protein [Bacteroidales bacterium]